jgi:hypothetical protein
MADRFLERLQQQRRQAASTEAPQEVETPTSAGSDELPSFADPAARNALLTDKVSDLEEKLGREREQRLQAERRLEAQAQPKTLSDVLHRLRRQRGAGRHW